MGLWVGIAIVLLVAIIIAAKLASPQNNTEPVTSGADAPPITAADWSLGAADAPVTLIEYGDYQCPACASYHALLEQFMEEYDGRVRFVFRNYPLTQIHDDAQLSAESAEAAGLQGKFWEMHDWLYENQLKWAVVPLTAQTIINTHAEELGLDMKKFAEDRKGDAVQDKIKADVDGANAIGVDHTPTFYVNLKQIPNPASYEEFKAVIDAALRGESATSTSANVTSTGTSTQR